MMRIGSIVSIVRINDDGLWYVPEGSPEGTIIAIENDCDADGYDRIESVTIRWNDGRIEITKTTGEDEKRDWEIDDVTPSLYANLYLYDRAYGGPEEGGWWFDTFSPIDGDWCDEPPRYGHFPTEEEAAEAYQLLQAWCDEENRSRRSPSSMASDGHFVARLESWPAEPMPARRPRYC